MMKSILSSILFFGATLCTSFSIGQSNPTPHDLSLSNYSFTGFSDGAITTYPTSMQGHRFGAERTVSNLTQEATADRDLLASTSGVTTGSIRNEVSNGISLLNSGTTNHIGAITIALNTLGREDLLATWTAGQIDTGGDRSNALVLQYRIGQSGTWTSVEGTTYTTQEPSGVTPPQTFTNVPLPSALNGQAVVQLRWIYYFVSGGGSRDRIGLDNVTISSSESFSPLADEPSNHATDFTCVNPTFASLDLEWTGSVGVQSPDGYLIKWSDVSYAAIVEPVDGTPEAGANILNVGHVDGLNTTEILGLDEGTTYFFKIWPFTNSGLDIDYKVGGEPQTSCATTSPFTLPSLHDLSSGNYTFTEWASSSDAGTYPSNMRFHFIASEQTGLSTANLSSFDFTCDYNLGARPRFNGNGGEGFSMVNTGSSQFNDCEAGAASQRFTGLAILGLNTLGQSNIAVNWTGRTIADNGSQRDYRIILQYRVGSEGNWTSVNGGEYFRYSGDDGNLENNIQGSNVALNQLLPSACEDQSEVYVRWLYYQEAAAGGGQRPELGVDDITVEAGVVAPTISDASCGLTDVMATQTISADPVFGATAYRFRVDNGSAVQVITKVENSFVLNELDAVPYNATVNVQVAVELDGVFSPYGESCSFETVPFLARLRNPDCSRILRLMNQMIYANYVGADEYTFEITDLNTSEIQFVTKNTRGFNLTEIENPVFGSEYQVRVRVVIAGIMQEFGSPCVITTPGSTAQLRTADCGRELINFEDIVYAIPQDADLWRFEVSNDYNQDVQVIESNTRELSFTQVATQVTGITYFIRVQIEENGVVQPYGDVCEVIAPTIRAQLRSTDCGKQLVSFAHLSYANVTSADLWIFELTNTSTMEFEVVEKNNRSIRLSDLSNPSNNVTYDVRVRVVINGVLQPYGRTCTLLAPVVGESLVINNDRELGGLTNEEQIEFKSSLGDSYVSLTAMKQRFDVYPNPATDGFSLKAFHVVEAGTYEVTVIDGMGRVVAVESLDESSLIVRKFGVDYAPGMYLIRVTHGNDVFQTRVVKR